MKTERRHELQTNVLASSLAHWIEKAKPYSRAVVAVLIAIAVGLGAWAYMSTEGTRREADGWNEFFVAIQGNNPDPISSLTDIANRYAGTLVGQWAGLQLAEAQLVGGSNLLLNNRVQALENLRAASERFQELLLDSTEREIRQRSSYGLAQAHEALGELELARADYATLIENYPDGPFATAAKARAADLEQASTKNFYDWLAKYEPPKPLAKEPGSPGARPDFMKEPDDGSILGGPSMKETPATGPALPSVLNEPTLETPVTAPAGETPPADAAPATEAPAAETPAGDAPPADAPAAAESEKPAQPQAEATPPAAEPAASDAAPQTP